MPSLSTAARADSARALPLQADAACAPLVFRVEASTDPGLLARALGLFAKLDLVPDHVSATRSGDRLDIEIRIATLDAGRADHVAQVIAGLIPVLRVSLETAA